MISALIQSISSIFIKVLWLPMLLAIIILYAGPRIIELLPRRIRRLINDVNMIEMRQIFLAGCYQVTGQLGSGKSYCSNYLAAKLAAHYNVPLITNYPITKFMDYAMRDSGLPLIDHRQISVYDPDNPLWKFGYDEYASNYPERPEKSKLKQDVTSVFVIDEFMYYMEVGAVKRTLIAQMIHARKRGQIVFILSQAPMMRQIKHILRYTMKCTYWIPIDLFRLQILSTTIPHHKRISRIATLNILRTRWFTRSYDTCQDFDEIELQEERIKNGRQELDGFAKKEKEFEFSPFT